MQVSKRNLDLILLVFWFSLPTQGCANDCASPATTSSLVLCGMYGSRKGPCVNPACAAPSSLVRRKRRRAVEAARDEEAHLGVERVAMAPFHKRDAIFPMLMSYANLPSNSQTSSTEFGALPACAEQSLLPVVFLYGVVFLNLA